MGGGGGWLRGVCHDRRGHKWEQPPWTWVIPKVDKKNAGCVTTVHPEEAGIHSSNLPHRVWQREKYLMEKFTNCRGARLKPLFIKQ